MKVAGLKKNKQMKGKDLKVPLRVRLTGLAYYDGPHARKDEFVIGHGHGSKKVARCGNCTRCGTSSFWTTEVRRA